LVAFGASFRFMAFRFRKIFKAGPLRFTLSKSGLGMSAGVRGFRVTKRADGRTQTTYGLPGTGLSYVSTSSSKGKAAAADRQQQRPSGSSIVSMVAGVVIVGLLLLLIVGLLLV
jgi:hypothetical protein